MDNIREELERLLRRYLIQELKTNGIAINDDIASTVDDTVEDAITLVDEVVNDLIFDKDNDENCLQDSDTEVVKDDIWKDAWGDN